MRKILKLGESPLKCYPNYASIFSIIGAENDDYLPWVYNYFIQLIVPNNHDWGMRMDFAPPQIISNLPWLNYNKIDRYIIDSKWEYIIDFIRDTINNDRYIFGLFDVSKIDQYNRKSPSPHEVLIFGFDDDKQEIYFADNYSQGKYMQGTTNYNNVINAYLGMNNEELKDWFEGIYLFNCRKVFDYGMYQFSNRYYYKFDIKLYVDLINDYLKGKNTYLRWTTPPALINYAKADNNVWGINIYDYIIEHLAMIQQGNAENDWRALYVLYEHKMLIQKTLRFLQVKNHLIVNKNLENLVTESIKYALLSLNRAIKSDLSGDYLPLSKVINNMKILRDYDIKIFNLINQELNDCI